MVDEDDARDTRGTDARLDLRIADDGSRVVFTLAGELDPHSAPTVRHAVDGLGDAAHELVLDLAGITFIDSSGLREIIHANQELTRREGHLVLRAPSATTMRLLQISGLTERLDLEA